jgi:hypothetical protein
MQVAATLAARGGSQPQISAPGVIAQPGAQSKPFVTKNQEKIKLRHKMSIAAVASAVWLTLGTPGLAIPPSQTIYLTIISRCGPDVVLTKASAYRDGRPPTDMPIPLTRIAPFFYTGQVTVAPGRYGVGASVGDKCHSGDEVTVLRGHDRHVGIEVGWGGTVWDANAFLYGTLPFTGFVGGTLIGPFGDEPIRVDGDAYYAERISTGSYVLKLSYGDGLECRVPVVITGFNEDKRFDISVEQMQQCVGFPYRYSGTGERGFILLFPSPSPSPSNPH